MPFLFHPGIKLMHYLNYRYKFAVIGLLAFGTPLYLFVLLSVNVTTSLDVARNEQAGLRMVRPMLALVQELQKYRGMSAIFLNGNTSVAKARLAREAEVLRAIAAVDAVEEPLGDRFKTVARWKTVKSHWEALRRDGLALSPTDNFAANTALVNDLLGIIGVVDENSELLLDPEANSYNLMDAATVKLPAALELLARLRGCGAGALTSRHIDEASRAAFAAEVAVLQAKMGELDTVLQRLRTANPDMSDELLDFASAFERKTDDVMRHVSDDIVTARFSINPVDYFDNATVGMDLGYAQLQQSMLPRLDELLQERTERLQWVIDAGVGSALLFILLFVYFGAAAYMAIMSSIESLAHGADLIAEGDLDARITLISKDELRRVAERFNHMADELQQRTGQLRHSDAALARALADYEKDRPLAMLAAVAPAIAHDLNTPIGNANLAASALHDNARAFKGKLAAGHLHRAELDAFLDDTMQGMDIIGKSLKRASELAFNLKQLSIDQTSERRRTFDLAQLINEVLSILAPTLRDQAWKIKVRVPPGISITGYPGPLGQVVINLVQNAGLHAFEGGRSGLLRIDVDELPDGRVCLRFADNGCGMSQDTLAHVFAPFFTTKIDSGGSGVGLTYARRLVMQTLGGDIGVESSEGKGTTFTLILPRVAPEQAEGLAQN